MVAGSSLQKIIFIPFRLVLVFWSLLTEAFFFLFIIVERVCLSFAYFCNFIERARGKGRKL